MVGGAEDHLVINDEEVGVAKETPVISDREVGEAEELPSINKEVGSAEYSLL